MRWPFFASKAKQSTSVAAPISPLTTELIDDRVGLVRGVVRLDLLRLGPVAHDERAGVAHAVGAHRADVMVAERRSGGADDPEGRPLEVKRPQPGMVEPEGRGPFEVGAADRDVDRTARAHSRGEDALEAGLGQRLPLRLATLPERRPRRRRASPMPGQARAWCEWAWSSARPPAGGIKAGEGNLPGWTFTMEFNRCATVCHEGREHSSV